MAGGGIWLPGDPEATRKPAERFPALCEKMRRYRPFAHFLFNEAWAGKNVVNIVDGNVMAGGGSRTNPHHALRWGGLSGAGAYIPFHTATGYTDGTLPDFSAGYTVLYTNLIPASTETAYLFCVGTTSGATRHFWQQQSTGAVRLYDGATWQNFVVDPPVGNFPFTDGGRVNVALTYDGGTKARFVMFAPEGSNYPPYSSLWREITVANATDLTHQAVIGARVVTFADTLEQTTMDSAALLQCPMSLEEAKLWARDPQGFWQDSNPAPFSFPLDGGGGGGGDTTNLPSAALDITGPVPQVTAVTATTTNLPSAALDITGPAPQVVTEQGATTNLPSAALDLTGPFPSITAIQNATVMLPTGNANLDGGVPSVHVSDWISLPSAALDLTGPVPTVTAGSDAVTNLPSAALDVTGSAPEVAATVTERTNLPSAALDITGSVPSITVPDVSPTITTPTPTPQTYRFGLSGTLDVPAHDMGTGDFTSWSFTVDAFSGQTGVTTWTINATTGDITYQIEDLSNDADVQALNMNGPYAVTRRLLTTVGTADDAFTVQVEVGNKTIQVTNGTPYSNWVTRTPGAKGLQAGKDDSALVQETYEIT